MAPLVPARQVSDTLDVFTRFQEATYFRVMQFRGKVGNNNNNNKKRLAPCQVQVRQEKKKNCGPKEKEDMYAAEHFP